MMNRTKGIILFKNILNLMEESEYIVSDLNKFLVRAMEDYCYDKKLGRSLEILFKYDNYLVDKKFISEEVFTDSFLAGRKDFANHIDSNFWNGDHIKITKENWEQLKEQLEINEDIKDEKS